MFFASACGDDQPADPKQDAGLKDGSTYVGADSGAGGGGSGASNAGGAGGSWGRGGSPAANGGKGGTSGSAGKSSAAGSGGLSTTGGSGGGGDLGAGCPGGLEGPALVKVPAPDDSAVSSYCVDVTEVTNAQYAAFLSASVATTGQDEACAWNMTYTPSKNWPATGMDEYPVVSVDWCDAFAFCKWAGKHMCGKIGGGESHLSFGYDDAAESEWFNACSAGGTSAYANGNATSVRRASGSTSTSPGTSKRRTWHSRSARRRAWAATQASTISAATCGNGRTRAAGRS